MEKKQNILKYRERLDQTLALPDLVSENSVEALINHQLLHSSPCEIEGWFLVFWPDGFHFIGTFRVEVVVYKSGEILFSFVCARARACFPPFPPFAQQFPVTQIPGPLSGRIP